MHFPKKKHLFLSHVDFVNVREGPLCITHPRIKHRFAWRKILVCTCSCLGKAILAQLNMDDGSDEIYEFYYKLIEKRCQKIRDDYSSLMKQTMKTYVALVAEKERRRSLVVV